MILFTVKEKNNLNRKYTIANQVEWAICECDRCGKIFNKPFYVASKGTYHYCGWLCFTKSKNLKNTGIYHSTYKNGNSRFTSTGYEKVGNKTTEHRLAMQEYLGRKLKPDEVVHHIDRDKTNNNLDNLVVMTRSEHTALHIRKKPVNALS